MNHVNGRLDPKFADNKAVPLMGMVVYSFKGENPPSKIAQWTPVHPTNVPAWLTKDPAMLTRIARGEAVVNESDGKGKDATWYMAQSFETLRQAGGKGH